MEKWEVSHGSGSVTLGLTLFNTCSALLIQRSKKTFSTAMLTKMLICALVGAPAMTNAPVIMFRPRAWNMLESNVMVRIYEPMYVFDARIFHCWLFIDIDRNFAQLDLRLSITDWQFLSSFSTGWWQGYSWSIIWFWSSYVSQQQTHDERGKWTFLLSTKGNVGL